MMRWMEKVTTITHTHTHAYIQKYLWMHMRMEERTDERTAGRTECRTDIQQRRCLSLLLFPNEDGYIPVALVKKKNRKDRKTLRCSDYLRVIP